MPARLAPFQRVARSGRLGAPVFLRLQLTGPPESAVARVAAAMAEAVALFDTAPASLFARGDEASGSLHAGLTFRSGACVLVTTGPGEETADGMLLGNHGAAYSSGPAALPTSVPRDLADDPADRDRSTFVALIQASLREGQTVRFDY
jgi:hypothetical protein